MSERALVTGASGFVGSHLAELLLGEGVEVRCLVRPESRPGWLQRLPVERVAASFADPAALAGAVAGCDYVFHAAGLTKGRSPAEYRTANVEATARLVAAVRSAAPGLRRLVYVSSLAAAGPCPGPAPLVEEDPPGPVDDYGRSKLAGEEAILAAAGELPVTIVRPPAVLGPRDRNFLGLFRVAQRTGMAPVLGDPAREVSLVHVADLVAGIWLAARAEAARGRSYFLPGGTWTFGAVLAALGPALGRRLRPVRIPDPVLWLAGEVGQLLWFLTGRPQVISRRKMRDLRRSRWACSAARASRELGFAPRFGLAAALADTARWYAAQGWLRPLPAAGADREGEPQAGLKPSRRAPGPGRR